MSGKGFVRMLLVGTGLLSGLFLAVLWSRRRQFVLAVAARRHLAIRCVALVFGIVGLALLWSMKPSLADIDAVLRDAPRWKCAISNAAPSPLPPASTDRSSQPEAGGLSRTGMRRRSSCG